MPKLLIKVCGLSTPETVDAAVDAGADLVGFVFHPKSPRYVTPARAAELARLARGRSGIVALTVDLGEEEIADIAAVLEPDWLQLHGAEPPESIAHAGGAARARTLKAIGVGVAEDLARVPAYAAVADCLLIDAKPPRDAAYPGGHGKPFDWAILKALDPAIPFLLAGGLTADNVAEAINTVRGFGLGLAGVDVSSAVESAPGVKDVAKIRAFVAAARAAGEGDGAHSRNRRRELPMNAPNTPNSYRTGPDERGFFGIFGGRFVAETLMPVILDLEAAYAEARNDPAFRAEMVAMGKTYIGRPSPLYFAERMTRELGGAKIYFKREELNHTGAHKVNNVLGQILLALRMGKKRIIAETGAGQHGVATATLCARYGLQCVVYMGAVDVERQKPNVFRMKMLGAEVIPVQSGSKTLKDAMNEALRDWVTNVENTFYCIGTVAGPHPYPAMVRDFQSVIGIETRAQMLEAEGRLPDSLVAAVGGGSNAIGLFHPFLDDPSVEIYGVEAAGHGLASGAHAASMAGGQPGVLHGNRTYLLMDADGQIKDAHSISAGLDYPGVGPEHSFLYDVKRVKYEPITDNEALASFQSCSRLEGIIPALESAHALALAEKLAPTKPKDHLMVVNVSGRGDKDIFTVAEHLGGM